MTVYDRSAVGTRVGLFGCILDVLKIVTYLLLHFFKVRRLERVEGARIPYYSFKLNSK
jgi:hypothetical protein